MIKTFTAATSTLFKTAATLTTAMVFTTTA